MRYQETAGGPLAEAICVVNGKDCTELQRTAHINIQECFISGEAEQKLKVRLRLDDVYSNCQADLVIDGIVRNTFLCGNTCTRTRRNVFEHGTWEIEGKIYRGLFKLAELPPSFEGSYQSSLLS